MIRTVSGCTWFSGPWNHGQGRREGRGIGPILFDGDTAGWFRRTIMQPFLDYYLKDGPKPDTPRVLVYETGADTWHGMTVGRAPASPAVRQPRVRCICWRTASWDSSRRRQPNRNTTSTCRIRRRRCRTVSDRHWTARRLIQPGISGSSMTNALRRPVPTCWFMRRSRCRSRCGWPDSRSHTWQLRRAGPTPTGS